MSEYTARLHDRIAKLRTEYDLCYEALEKANAELAALKAAGYLQANCPWCGETLRIDWQNRVIHGVTEPFDDEVSE